MAVILKIHTASDVLRVNLESAEFPVVLETIREIAGASPALLLDPASGSSPEASRFLTEDSWHEAFAAAASVAALSRGGIPLVRVRAVAQPAEREGNAGPANDQISSDGGAATSSGSPSPKAARTEAPIGLASPRSTLEQHSWPTQPTQGPPEQPMQSMQQSTQPAQPPPMAPQAPSQAAAPPPFAGARSQSQRDHSAGMGNSMDWAQWAHFGQHAADFGQQAAQFGLQIGQHAAQFGQQSATQASAQGHGAAQFGQQMGMMAAGFGQQAAQFGLRMGQHAAQFGQQAAPFQEASAPVWSPDGPNDLRDEGGSPSSTAPRRRQANFMHSGAPLEFRDERIVLSHGMITGGLRLVNCDAVMEECMVTGDVYLEGCSRLILASGMVCGSIVRSSASRFTKQGGMVTGVVG